MLYLGSVISLLLLISILIRLIFNLKLLFLTHCVYLKS